MRYYVYHNNGGINQVIDRVIDKTHFYIKDLLELFTIYKKYPNLSIINYAFDTRIYKRVFMLIGDHSGLKGQFICFVFAEEE